MVPTTAQAAGILKPHQTPGAPTQAAAQPGSGQQPPEMKPGARAVDGQNLIVIGGYHDRNHRVSFVQPRSATMLCIECYHIAKEPFEIQCPKKHLLCRDCIEHYRSRSGFKRGDGKTNYDLPCESCEISERKKGVSHEQRDAAFYRPSYKTCFSESFSSRIGRLEVRCKQSLYGCHWTGTYGQLPEHLKDCGYLVVKCVDCKELFIKCFEERHYQGHPRPLQCILCDRKTDTAQLQRHLVFDCEARTGLSAAPGGEVPSDMAFMEYLLHMLKESSLSHDGREGCLPILPVDTTPLLLCKACKDPVFQPEGMTEAIKGDSKTHKSARVLQKASHLLCPPCFSEKEGRRFIPESINDLAQYSGQVMAILHGAQARIRKPDDLITDAGKEGATHVLRDRNVLYFYSHRGVKIDPPSAHFHFQNYSLTVQYASKITAPSRHNRSGKSVELLAMYHPPLDLAIKGSRWRQHCNYALLGESRLLKNGEIENRFSSHVRTIIRTPTYATATLEHIEERYSPFSMFLPTSGAGELTIERDKQGHQSYLWQLHHAQQYLMDEWKLPPESVVAYSEAFHLEDRGDIRIGLLSGVGAKSSDWLSLSIESGDEDYERYTFLMEIIYATDKWYSSLCYQGDKNSEYLKYMSIYTPALRDSMRVHPGQTLSVRLNPIKGELVSKGKGFQFTLHNVKKFLPQAPFYNNIHSSFEWSSNLITVDNMSCYITARFHLVQGKIMFLLNMDDQTNDVEKALKFDNLQVNLSPVETQKRSFSIRKRQKELTFHEHTAEIKTAQSMYLYLLCTIYFWEGGNFRESIDGLRLNVTWSGAKSISLLKGTTVADFTSELVARDTTQEEGVMERELSDAQIPAGALLRGTATDETSLSHQQKEACPVEQKENQEESSDEEPIKGPPEEETTI